MNSPHLANPKRRLPAAAVVPGKTTALRTGLIKFQSYRLAKMLGHDRWLATHLGTGEKWELLFAPPGLPLIKEELAAMQAHCQAMPAAPDCLASHEVKWTVSLKEAAILSPHRPGTLLASEKPAQPEQILRWLQESCRTLRVLKTAQALPDIDWAGSVVSATTGGLCLRPRYDWRQAVSRFENASETFLVHGMIQALQPRLTTQPNPALDAGILDGVFDVDGRLSKLAPMHEQLKVITESWWGISKRWLPLPRTPATWLMSTPVTVGEWRMVMRCEPPVVWDDMEDNHPVIGLRHGEAVTFAQALQRYYAACGILPKGRHLRLPDQTEWMAARGGLPTTEATFSACCWNHQFSTRQQSQNHVTTVARRQPRQGFYDLLGNIGEWGHATAKATRAPVFGGSYRKEDMRFCRGQPQELPVHERHPTVGLRLLAEQAR